MIRRNRTRPNLNQVQVETITYGRRFVGMSLILVGFLGILYIGWTYVVLAKTLPIFPSGSVLETEGVSVTASDGFRALVGAEVAVIPAQVPTVLPDNTLDVDRTLGLLDEGSEGENSADVSITVPRLGIKNARIELDVNGDDERIYNSVLTRAVAHLKKSAYPGQIGNTFIFGHSRLSLLARNDYESIFTNLPQVKTGDVVEIAYKGNKYVYQITQTGVVEPTDTFVMNQPPTKRMVTLMTCIPPGFASQRYVTVGELVKVTTL